MKKFLSYIWQLREWVIDMVVIEEKNNEIHKLEEKIQYLESIIALLPGNVYWLDRNNIYQGCNNVQAEAANLQS